MEAAVDEMMTNVIPHLSDKYNGGEADVESLSEQDQSFFSQIITEQIDLLQIGNYWCCAHINTNSIMPMFSVYGDTPVSLYCEKCFEMYVELARRMNRDCRVCGTENLENAVCLTGQNYLGIAVFMCNDCRDKHMNQPVS